jgi:plasmid stabilization system protein ParE
MDCAVIYSTAALSDLRAITEFIANDDGRTAGAFANRLVDLAESLARMPERGRRVKGWNETRVVVLSPYLIFYRFDRSAGEVQVLRFWHGARDPGTIEL